MNYIGMRDSGDTYVFRNGTRIITKEGIDSVTIAVVFLKKDYGDVWDNATVIDIGANIGVYSIFVASQSKGTIVYAYEPMPTNFDLLSTNIDINGLRGRILAFPVGVAGTRGRRKLYVARSSLFHSVFPNEKTVDCAEMNCVSLQDIFVENGIGRCDILKLDCEGAEFEILYSAPRECFEKIREIRLEYHNQATRDDYNVRALICFLGERGFRLRRLNADSECLGTVWLVRQ